MEINNGTLFRLLEKMMLPHAKFVHGTYNPQDPTAYTDGTAYVSFDYDPLTKDDEYAIPKHYEIRYHDVTWGVSLYITEIYEREPGFVTEKIITDNGKGPFPNGIYFDHQDDKICRDADDNLIQHFILAMLTDGEWSNSKPTFDVEWDCFDPELNAADEREAESLG